MIVSIVVGERVVLFNVCSIIKHSSIVHQFHGSIEIIEKGHTFGLTLSVLIRPFVTFR